MQAVSDLSNEELRLQRSHFISRLYGWSLFSIIIFEWLVTGSIVSHEPAALKQRLARLWGCFSALLTGN